MITNYHNLLEHSSMYPITALLFGVNQQFIFSATEETLLKDSIPWMCIILQLGFENI